VAGTTPNTQGRTSLTLKNIPPRERSRLVAMNARTIRLSSSVPWPRTPWSQQRSADIEVRARTEPTAPSAMATARSQLRDPSWTPMRIAATVMVAIIPRSVVTMDRTRRRCQV